MLPSGEEQSKGEREHCLLERGSSPAPKASLIGGVRRQEMRGLNPSAVQSGLKYPLSGKGMSVIAGLEEFSLGAG